MARPRKSTLAEPDQPLRCESIHQLGGIRTGSLDHPNPMGGQSCRVAFVDTGGGLRFTVALDRGGDIVEAFHNQHSLAYLTPNGYVPPSHAYHRGDEWLQSWPGGLLTACGPRYIGAPRLEDGVEVTQHGHHSNTPAAVEMILNPDPVRGKREMLLSMVIRDSRLYGPVIEVRRQIQCMLGVPQIHLYDQVTNRGNTPVAHHWLYHVNLGYPLLDEGAQLVYRGKARALGREDDGLTAAALNRFKRVAAPSPEHAGSTSDLLFVDVPADRAGEKHVGLVNRKLGLGLELSYPAQCLPRFANWQHFGPDGCYVTGLEPFSGSLLGQACDPHPDARQQLAPGQTRRYQLTIRVHHDRAGIASLMKHDGPLQPAAML